jgi:F-type H+-transporting ATPase subunit b
MNSVFLLAAATDTIKEISTQFGVTWQLLISQVVLFVIVAVALKKFAYAPILQTLEERRRRIAEGLANADKIKNELATAQSKSQEILNQASAQATKIIEEARAAAGKVTEIETQKAIAAANDIIAKARLASEAELARMKAELRKEVGRLVISTTVKVTGKVLTADDQQRLADETNRQLAA